MDRGFIGTTPLGTERDDDSYLDFVEGLRVFNLTKLDPVARKAGEQAVEAFVQRTGRMPANFDEVRAIFDAMPIMATRKRFHRSDQEMMWQGVMDTYAKREAELVAELDAYDKRGPGSVQWDPNFVYPEYFSTVDFHIQPGGYHAYPLTGLIYHYGTKVFFTGRNNNDDVQRELAYITPVPPDGQVRRILDSACGIGQAATAFKERFPDAEVWGTDVGAPMVRYAHKRAVDMGLDVHFAQRLSEDTGFPDNYFDIVSCFLLFHEIPQHIIERVVHETHRILRPGGVFAIYDFPSNRPNNFGPVQMYFRDFDNRDNGEPYAGAFVTSDFHGLLRRYFREVNENFKPDLWIPSRVCVK